MPSAALPFSFRRSRDSYTAMEMTSTRETVHGLLSIHGDDLRIQWRVARKTDRYGMMEVRSDEELCSQRPTSGPSSV